MTKKKLKLYLRIYYLLSDVSTRELKLAKLFFSREIWVGEV